MKRWMRSAGRVVTVVRATYSRVRDEEQTNIQSRRDKPTNMRAPAPARREMNRSPEPAAPFAALSDYRMEQGPFDTQKLTVKSTLKTSTRIVKFFLRNVARLNTVFVVRRLNFRQLWS